MKKRYKYFLSLIGLFLTITSCSTMSINEKISKMLGIEIVESIEIDYEDNHSGFHGDGEMLAFIKLDEASSKKIQSEIQSNKEWLNLPLSENLELLMYGGERNSNTYNYNLADKSGIPAIGNGYYFFLNRHSNRVSAQDDLNIFNESSFNFTLAIYDTDVRVIYYFEFDT